LAVAGSLVVHGGLAVLLLMKSPTASTPRFDAVEIDFDVPANTTEAPTVAPVGSQVPALATEPPTPVESTRTRPADGRGDRTKSSVPTAGRPTPTNEPASRPPGGARDGLADRLATFQPAHPDLHGPMKFPIPEETRRDPLAPPVARLGVQPSDLPKVIQGGSGVTASVAEDGRISLHDPKSVDLNRSPFQAVGSGVGVGVSGHLDLNDQLMKLVGQDPYASAKRKIAEETREQRICMARRYQGEQQKQELFALSTKVRRIASRADLSLAQRRELVFAIWDECTEESGSATDFGAMARATILSIAREAFPEGTSEAYQPAELLALNGRRSSAERFAPYAASSLRHSRHPPDGGPPTECP